MPRSYSRVSSVSNANSSSDNTRLYIILSILAFAIIVGVLVGSSYKEKFTNNNSSVSLVYFYHRNCKHCVDFQNTWSSMAANRAYNNISFVKYDVEAIEPISGQKYGDKYGIQYYPTIMLIKTEQTKEIFDSNTERTPTNIIRWVNEITNLNLPVPP